MSEVVDELVKRLKDIFITNRGDSSDFSQSREILTPGNREMSDSLHCPYCGSTDFVRRGTRKKKMESVQLYLCKTCRRTFTHNITKGKHYPLDIVLDAVSIYNLGYSLEETCRVVNSRNSKLQIPNPKQIPNSNDQNATHNPVILSGSEGSPANAGSNESRDSSGRTPQNDKEAVVNLQPSTLATWVSEFEPLCRYCQMRPYVTKKYSPKDVVIHATLVHRQLYRYRFHRGKCEMLIENEYKHRRFKPLMEFLEMVPAECPHQYFEEGKYAGMRASETPLTFSKTAMIVQAKQNFATRLCEFVLQSVHERKNRHEALQKFMLANDSVTVATEVPVYIMRDDLLHLKTQLGFEIYLKDEFRKIAQSFGKPAVSDVAKSAEGQASATADAISGAELPKLITGHIDILQIRNGMVHILDYKPKAEKERPIEQLTLYAMALSRLTGLRLYEFKCAWFDEKDYFEFYPLHVLHKPKRAERRKKINTKEGTYLVNKEVGKVKSLRPML